MTEPSALIVEDDADLSEIFREALSAAEFSTEVIRDGQVAQARLLEIVPTVVILDLHLPHVSGETLLKQIRATPQLNATRVVITTADAVAAEFLRDSADFVMVKPISYVQLRDLAKRLNPALQTDRFKKHIPPSTEDESKK
jgi:DNA-binding response OmpR family regulator